MQLLPPCVATVHVAQSKTHKPVACPAAAAARWYSDAFHQAGRQDALDVLSGAFTLAAGFTLHWRNQPSKMLLLVVAGVQLLFVAGQLIAAALGRLASSTVEAVIMVLIPLVAGLVMLGVVLWDSDCYVCWPELCGVLLPRQQPWKRVQQPGSSGPCAVGDAAPAMASEPKKTR